MVPHTPGTTPGSGPSARPWRTDYDIQWLSMRTTTYRRKHLPGWLHKKLMANDYVHPQDAGHKAMADLCVWLFTQTAIDVMLRPADASELELLHEDLPEPIYPGNHVPSRAFCLHPGEGLLLAMEEEGRGCRWVSSIF